MASNIDMRSLKPSQTDMAYWLSAMAPSVVVSRGNTYGKWLVFKHKSKMDELWEEVSKEVESGYLLATGAKVSTMKPNPNATNPEQLVICVYTTLEDIDEVGMRLVNLVKQTIRYKSDEATLAGVYSNRGYKKTTIKTITWKDGKASIVE
ncbi:hypothetical protein LOD99_8463 [Oopsacas minuta]|uniref:Uncharacterized protein n=1 Tax=Oopsacas minuta TaxID=111878 RepID=A0AAV7JHD1_9METZ|nr:hypothetical protein LOD99_8463 [Oopsacas minuta]